MAYLIVFLTFTVCITVQYFMQRGQEEATAPATEPTARPGGQLAAGAASMSPGIDADLLTHAPRGVFVAPGHTWIQLEGFGGVRLGCDRFPLTALGKVDRLDVVPEGTEVREGDVVAQMSSGKRGLRLLSPVEGTVTAVNRSLTAQPGDLHADPYEKGWFCSIWPERLGESIKRMVIGEETEGWMRNELRRLRDTLASREGQLTALADGGAPVEGLACCLDLEDWEEFIDLFFEAPARPDGAS